MAIQLNELLSWPSLKTSQNTLILNALELFKHKTGDERARRKRDKPVQAL